MLLDHIQVPPLQLRHVEPEHVDGDMIQPEHSLFGLVWINLERVSGTPCFFGTRVPVATLFNRLGGGQSLAEFLDAFEGVHEDQAVAVLDLAARGILSELNAIESAARSQRAAAAATKPAGA